MGKKLHNTGATELVYDLDGHAVAAGETVVVEKTDARTRALLKSRALLELKESTTADKNGDN